MKINEKLMMDRNGLINNGPITIVAFGDSVTHGALANGVIDYETVYWNVLKQKINAVRNYVPVNVINAGIGGACASDSVERMDSQVLAHSPDLIIVCFGLNDINRPLEQFLDALKAIFKKAQDRGCDIIYMSPNMLNTYVAEDTADSHRDYAKITAEVQNSGKMDAYIAAAIKLGEEMNVPVCDCYSQWKECSKTEDTTKMLINRVNHPNRAGHVWFAENLFKMLFPSESTEYQEESTMYRG